MKLTIFFLLIWFTANLNSLDEPLLKVVRTASDDQIREVERQVLKQYGIKAEVKVINRNDKGEITNLNCIRYDKVGKRTDSCSSDNFGLLIITQHGCKISDLGYEDKI
ncbi:hypothetical protein G8759_00490 [Spirosoma aureum]|uniref:Uncharacterized protein n=1 Tax=Spirosoma aureum TaxID=2692134 RepID=A0A6G9AFV9_9BACT|nr:hypothetical protein [Spirosoma aureum]QIP11224.1 hypothetical protein G8759_00490 [Spirosoma aureum]